MMISSTIIINKLLRIQNNFHSKNHHLLFYHRSGFNVGKLSSSLSSSFCIQNHQQQRSLSSTSTTSTSTTIESSSSKRNCDKLDLTFSNTEQAYRSKTTFELIRAIAVLYVSSFDTLVYNHDKLLKWSKRLMGERLFNLLMRSTFYGQFVAGIDEFDIKPVLNHLRSFGVKSILDYSAEEDIEKKFDTISNKQKGKDKIVKQYEYDDVVHGRRELRPVARTYFYMNEAQCEKNMDIFLRCIDCVAGATYGTGFAAIKLTALGRPELLLQLSEVIARTRKYFKQITGLNSIGLGNITPEEFQKQLDKRFNLNVDNPEIAAFLKQMDYDQRGLMNLFAWNGLIDMDTLINDLFKVPNLRTGRMEMIINALNQEEEEMFRNMMRRMHTIARAATERDVRVLIDAEQTYFQPAINRITLELMRKYNKEKAIIFNTYQCYLKNAYETCELDAELSRRQGFYFGAKLVRGAYLEQERLRAKQLGYNDPINPTFESTTAMYEKNLNFFMNKIVDTGIDQKKFAIMVASHNEDTVRYTLKKMQELDIKPEHKLICFGQLYGMSDHLSFILGQSGYSVYKYVPYGPIDKVMPYLSRRALENHGLLKKSKYERKLLMKELLRRIWNGKIFHKPIGNYQPI
uniref:Proline dehydrogenase n=2 Tax=Dermatophagoides pteronyssinus TaxID=6956 RepID=A0A6P6Y7I3_DERPT|nr:proline dehydrogenase 1, mitochondrial-like [Dermatophagoides pteronyssinus]